MLADKSARNIERSGSMQKSRDQTSHVLRLQPGSLRRASLSSCKRESSEKTRLDIRHDQALRRENLPFLFSDFPARQISQPCNIPFLQRVWKHQGLTIQSHTEVHDESPPGRRHYPVWRRSSSRLHLHRRHYLWNSEDLHSVP